MVIDSIQLTVNGCEVTLKNVDGDQLANIVKALEGKPADKAAKRRVDKTKGNYQSDEVAQPLPPKFDSDKAYNHRVMLKSKDTGSLLKPSSRQVVARKTIVSVFVMNKNNPLTKSELVENMAYISNLSAAAINTYTSYLLKSGVLSSNTRTGKLHISSWFLNEASK